MSIHKVRHFVQISAVVIALLTHHQANARYYHLIEIIPPGTSTIVWVRAINNHGAIVGTAGSPGSWIPFLRTSDGVFKDIGTYGGYYGAGANGINERGDIIIGLSWEGLGLIRTSFGKLIQMPKDIFISSPTSINDRQQVLASGLLSGMRGFIWDPRTDTRTLLDPSETYYSQPYDMNNSMWAVGDAWDSNTSRRAFLFTPRKKMQLLPASETGASYARGINEYGVVVGSSHRSQGWWSWLCSTYWDKKQVPHFIPIASDTKGAAEAINNAGDIVGYCQRNWNDTGFLYKEGIIRYLEDLVQSNSGWRITHPRDINDRGWIITDGMRSGGGGIRALLLIPPLEIECGPLVPGKWVDISVSGAEPGALALFFMGYKGIGSGPCYKNFGFCLDLLDPFLIGIKLVDRFGEASIKRWVPTRSKGVDIYLQAAVGQKTTWNVVGPITNKITRLK